MISKRQFKEALLCLRQDLKKRDDVAHLSSLLMTQETDKIYEKKGFSENAAERKIQILSQIQ